MAVTSDLPELQKPRTANSVLLDRNGRNLGLLTGNQQRFFIRSEEIAPTMKQAIVAIEDRRFWTNEGIDLRGIGRALYQDVRAQEAVQGGSTITMQLVKFAMAAENDRTLFNKLREAALAYEITRKWTKEEILRTYLNTIYFGNGAYGIESAARTYFGNAHPGCGEGGQPRCAQLLAPHEAALIAGIVASPSLYDPLRNKVEAKKRRDLVLQRMLEQGYITREQYDNGVLESLPTSQDVRPPAEDTAYPYFTSWVKQQVVDKFGGGQEGARRAFEGGLVIRTTLDSRLQDAAEEAVNAWLPDPAGPRASLVALDNDTGEVLAMVGGDDYATRPFNLATQGQRQPGSSFKPFILAEALTQGISADSTWASQPDRHLRGQDEEGPLQGVLQRQQLRGRLRGRAVPAHGDHVLRQLRLRPGRHARRHPQDRQPRAPHGHPHAGLQEPGDDARRPARGRHPARHGARVPDVRPARPLHVHDAEPRRGRALQAGPARARAGGHQADRPPRRRRAQGRRAAERARRRSASRRAGPCSRRRSPTRSPRSSPRS